MQVSNVFDQESIQMLAKIQEATLRDGHKLLSASSRTHLEESTLIEIIAHLENAIEQGLIEALSLDVIKYQAFLDLAAEPQP